MTVQAYGIWCVTLMSLGFSLRMIWAVSGSSVRDTSLGMLKEVCEDDEGRVATEDICKAVGVRGEFSECGTKEREKKKAREGEKK